MKSLPSLWGFVFGVYVLMSTATISYVFKGLPEFTILLKVFGFGAIISFAVALSLSFVVAEVSKSKSISASRKRTD